MSSNVINQMPFLRTSRNFPEDQKLLLVQINKAYVDTANCVNDRTIGLYPTNFPAITGNQFFLSGNLKQQTLRQVYQFTSAGNIAHGINTSTFGGFILIIGTFTDGSVWYPLPYVDSTAANNQVSIQVTSTNIVITAGG